MELYPQVRIGKKKIGEGPGDCGQDNGLLNTVHEPIPIWKQ